MIKVSPVSLSTIGNAPVLLRDQSLILVVQTCDMKPPGTRVDLHRMHLDVPPGEPLAFMQTTVGYGEPPGQGRLFIRNVRADLTRVPTAHLAAWIETAFASDPVATVIADAIREGRYLPVVESEVSQEIPR